MLQFWKKLIYSFFVVVFFVVFTPESLNQGIVGYVHFGLTLILIANCIALVVFPIVYLLINKERFGAVNTTLGILFTLVFNVLGSIFLYFYLRNREAIA